jgi:hypothetical protein
MAGTPGTLLAYLERKDPLSYKWYFIKTPKKRRQRYYEF